MKAWVYSPVNSLRSEIPDIESVYRNEGDLICKGLFIIWQFLLRLAVRLLFHCKVSGLENLPADGSYVLISNHTSHFDTICLFSIVPLWRVNHTYPAAAEDHFFVTRWKALFASKLFNAFPFCRSELKGTHRSLLECRKLLSNNRSSLIFFPEGERSRSGVLQPFRRGIGFIVANTQHKVVPVHIQGAFESWPKGQFLPKPGKLQINIGKPMTFTHVRRNSDNYLQVAKQIEHELRKLMNNETGEGAKSENTIETCFN